MCSWGKSGTSCEAAAEETPVLAMVDKRRREGVETEHEGHVNLKVVGLVRFEIKVHATE